MEEVLFVSMVNEFFPQFKLIILAPTGREIKEIKKRDGILSITFAYSFIQTIYTTKNHIPTMA
ncbi:TPA: hypothetical protein KTG45_004363 [Escherichia coli]|nr:hypothetical protein [Escherichia coli]